MLEMAQHRLLDWFGCLRLLCHGSVHTRAKPPLPVPDSDKTDPFTNPICHPTSVPNSLTTGKNTHHKALSNQCFLIHKRWESVYKLKNNDKNKNPLTGVKKNIQLAQNATPPATPTEGLGDAGGTAMPTLLINKYISSSKTFRCSGCVKGKAAIFCISHHSRAEQLARLCRKSDCSRWPRGGSQTHNPVWRGLGLASRKRGGFSRRKAELEALPPVLLK